MLNELDKLKRDGELEPPTDRKNITDVKRRMNGICRTLNIETAQYDPLTSINLICKYYDEDTKLRRLMYSEISNYVFSLKASDRGVFATNADSLVQYVFDDNNHIDELCISNVIKLYDHIHLAICQTDNTQEKMATELEGVKDSFHKDIKTVEREYITILGIFSSIILAFVGGITFSSAVLENLSSASVFRLALVVVLLGFILINILYLLLNFIAKINEKNIKIFKIKQINIAFLIIAIFIFLLWMFNIHMLGEYFSNVLPW